MQCLRNVCLANKYFRHHAQHPLLHLQTNASGVSRGGGKMEADPSLTITLNINKMNALIQKVILRDYDKRNGVVSLFVCVFAAPDMFTERRTTLPPRTT